MRYLILLSLFLISCNTITDPDYKKLHIPENFHGKWSHNSESIDISKENIVYKSTSNNIQLIEDIKKGTFKEINNGDTYNIIRYGGAKINQYYIQYNLEISSNKISFSILSNNYTNLDTSFNL